MPILYINPLWSSISIHVLENNQEIYKELIPRNTDFDRFPDTIIEIIEKYHPNTLWTIVWPWPFTRMRIVTLCISSICRVYWIVGKECHFFDLIQNNTPILMANNEEYITKENTRIVIVNKRDLKTGRYEWYGHENDFTDGKVYIEYKENWEELHSIFDHCPEVQIFSPIYLKEPHITCSKKNKSPS